jgi:PAS domain S-box-containing protein
MDIIAIQYLVAIFAAIVGFASALKPVRNCWFWAWGKTFGRKEVARKEFEKEMRDALALLLGEMRPNGGDSMRDAIDRIKDRQNDFEAFLNAQLNIGNEAVFRTDPQGHVISNNRRHQHLTGFSMAQVEGDGWVNVIHPDWRTKTHAKWHSAVAEGREFSEDIMYVNPDGESYMVHVNAFRERDGEGRIRGYLGVVTPLAEKSIRCPHVDMCAAATKGRNEENS